MNEDLTPKETINNEYDYSNILPTVEAISYLIQYLDNVYKNFKKRISEDKEKNKQFKEQYKEYMYKKAFSENFEIHIYEKNYNNISCTNYQDFAILAKDNKINRLNSLQIRMCLDFGRGKSENIEKHENEFKIVFKPYDITFIRKSNHNDPSMNNIEEQIKAILNQFQVSNSIFCTK